MGSVFPTTTQLYCQRVQVVPKILPGASNVITKLFFKETSTKIGNSPVEMLLLGINSY